MSERQARWWELAKLIGGVAWILAVFLVKLTLMMVLAPLWLIFVVLVHAAD